MGGISPELAKATVGPKKEAIAFRPMLNRVDIQLANFDNDFSKQAITIYLPTYSNPRIYWDRTLLSVADERTEIMKLVTELANRLEPLRTQNINMYRKQFMDGIQQEILPELYVKFFEGKIHEKFMRKHEEEDVVEIRRRTLESFKAFQQKGNIETTYRMDPYIIFEELVHDTLQPNGVAFMMGAGLLVQVTKEMVTNKPYISPFEQEGDNEIRCIPRCKEFIEQQL